MEPDHRDLKSTIDPARLPAHVAIIMDGNGRWAEKKRRPRIFGHKAGVNTVDNIVTFASELGIKALTLYSFSTENWKRPVKEVGALMGVLEEFLMKKMKKMIDNNIRFNTIGRLEDLPESALRCIDRVKEATRENTGTILTLALSYSSRNEITNAVTAIAEKVKSGELAPDKIDPETVEKHLDTAGLPEVDLLIRTSGELRISNFLLWQLAYAELHFTDVLWPDFGEDDFVRAILDFQKRERRFGLSGDQLKERKSTGGRRPQSRIETGTL